MPDSDLAETIRQQVREADRARPREEIETQPQTVEE